MASEIAGAVAGVRLLMDVIKANKTLANYNELVAAVSEVNADLLSAQGIALASQKEQLALTKRVSELEKEITQLKNWEREAERYQLTEIDRDAFVRRMKAGMEQGEDPHDLCANCFSDGKKSILQLGPRAGGMETLHCSRCQATLFVSPLLRRKRPVSTTNDPA